MWNSKRSPPSLQQNDKGHREKNLFVRKTRRSRKKLKILMSVPHIYCTHLWRIVMTKTLQWRRWSERGILYGGKYSNGAWDECDGGGWCRTERVARMQWLHVRERRYRCDARSSLYIIPKCKNFILELMCLIARERKHMETCSSTRFLQRGGSSLKAVSRYFAKAIRPHRYKPNYFRTFCRV